MAVTAPFGAAGIGVPWARDDACQRSREPRCAALPSSADGDSSHETGVLPCRESQRVDDVAANLLTQVGPIQCMFFLLQWKTFFGNYTRFSLKKVQLIHLSWQRPVKGILVFPATSTSFLCMRDGPIVMVARLPRICVLQCVDGDVSVSARVSFHTTRAQFVQRCTCYRQSLLDNADGALQTARCCVERVKESLRQQEQRRAGQWYMDSDMHKWQLSP